MTTDNKVTCAIYYLLGHRGPMFTVVLLRFVKGEKSGIAFGPTSLIDSFMR